MQRHMQAEHRVGVGLSLVERAAERGADHRTRGRELDALAYAVWPARPAGVEQEDANIVASQLFAQHARVDLRRERQERRAEASREGRLGVCYADLGAGSFGGVAGEKVVARL